VWGGRRMRTQMVQGRNNMRTWRVWGRSTTRTWRVHGWSTTAASQTMREGRVMGLLHARHPNTVGSGGATWSPLL
jgi:hypothetical protein